jgi:hypothetical protein
MSQSALSASVSAVLARFDRSNPEKLLASLAAEIVRLNREQADLAARLLAVERLQSVADRLLPADAGQSASDELPKDVLIDATHSLLDGTGFYPLEFDATGVPYRWTGPDAQFSLPLFIDRQHGGKFKLYFSRFAAQVSPSFMRCLVDGKPADITVHKLATGFELSGDLLPRHDGGASVLSFTVPATASPAQLGQSNDTRQLGLCFQKLTVQAVGAPEHSQNKGDADTPGVARKSKRPA